MSPDGLIASLESRLAGLEESARKTSAAISQIERLMAKLDIEDAAKREAVEGLIAALEHSYLAAEGWREAIAKARELWPVRPF